MQETQFFRAVNMGEMLKLGLQPEIRERRKLVYGFLPFYSVYGACHIGKGVFPNSIKAVQKILYKHTGRFISLATLDPLILAINIYHCKSTPCHLKHPKITFKSQYSTYFTCRLMVNPQCEIHSMHTIIFQHNQRSKVSSEARGNILTMSLY